MTHVRIAAKPITGIVVTMFLLAGSVGAPAWASRTSHVNKTTATKTITVNWEKFFSGKTSAKTKIALLQDGTKFASVIDAQASSALAKGASATVTKVSNITSTKATVRYTVDLDGQPALKNTTGTALWLSATWKVSDASFCALLGLEQVKTPACPRSK